MNKRHQRPPICKYCNSIDTVWYGSYAGIKYVWCIVCKRKFINKNTIALKCRYSQETVAGVLEQYRTGISMHEIRRTFKFQYGVKLSLDTISQWIKKYGKSTKVG